MAHNGNQRAQSEKRGAYRVSCDLPVVVRHGADKRAEGRLGDLSRLGVCLRVPGDLLKVHRLSSLVHVARQVAAVLGPRFDAWLGGADGIARTLEPVRICQRNWESRDVELGCLLNRPLTDDELATLGVSAPPLHAKAVAATSGRTSAPATWTSAGGTPVHPAAEDRIPLGATGHSEPRFMGFVVAEETHTGRPMQGHTQMVTNQEAVLVVPSFERTVFGQMDIASLIVAFAKSYGERPMFRLVQGTRSLWAGPVRLTEVETPATRSGAMRLRVQFEDPLTESQRRQLGLAS